MVTELWQAGFHKRELDQRLGRDGDGGKVIHLWGNVLCKRGFDLPVNMKVEAYQIKWHVCKSWNERGTRRTNPFETPDPSDSVSDEIHLDKTSLTSVAVVQGSEGHSGDLFTAALICLTVSCSCELTNVGLLH